MTSRLALVLVVALALIAAFPGAARAQEADSVEYFAPEGGALARAGVTPYGDVRIRRERVHARPGASEDLDLARGIVRAGLRRAPPGSWLSGEAGVRLTTDIYADDAWTPVLNEGGDVIDVDRLGLWGTTESGALTVSVGKQRSPIALTEMLWDGDLRPVGVAMTVRRDLSSVTGRFGAAAFQRSRLRFDNVRVGAVGAVQVAAAFREEAVSGAEVVVTWLRFDPNVEREFIRQNAMPVVFPAPSVLISDFDVLDAQLGMRGAPGGIPLSFRLDLARNVAIDRDRDGVRVRLAVGGPGLPAGAEVGWVFQRLEREATVGAFNSDDWWFHTRMRGHQIWARVDAKSWLEARLAGFHERRDDVSRPTRRLTLELRARLPQS